MFPDEHRDEWIADARSEARRRAFRAAQRKTDPLGLDELLAFLDSIQRIFGPWKVSRRKTLSALNKL